MQGEGDNIKDTLKDSLKDTNSAPISIDFSPISVGTYNKTGKLIAALYMVTDIMDREEPIRGRLRALGSSILSDAYLLATPYRTGSLPKSSDVLEIERKVMELVSFLEISSSVGMISEMNSNILKTEFLELKQSLKVLDTDLEWLQKFFDKNHNHSSEEISGTSANRRFSYLPNRAQSEQNDSQNVQKKNTEIPEKMSDRNNGNSVKDMEVLKGQRREGIIKIVKNMPEGATITDIRSKATGSLLSCGEKTLQRELSAMVSDGVLKKEGEKRWSRYYINN